MAYKKITEVNPTEELKHSDSILVISDGELKQLPSSKVNVGGGKFKTGDVVCLTTKMTATNNIKIIPWDTYKENPSNYNAIGLVVDPIKRTFLFCDLSTYRFSTVAGREKLGKYSSFDNGMETHKRVRGIEGSHLQDYFPVFYFTPLSNHDVFYPRCKEPDNFFVPSLNEWTSAYKEICTAFYDYPETLSGDFGSAMDRLIAAKTGVSVGTGLFFKKIADLNSLFYSQLSTIGMTTEGENAYNMSGNVPDWSDDNNYGTPIFGIYSEEEENA